jgi:actin-related protein 6
MRGKANSILCNYVLPDFVNLMRGQIVEQTPSSNDLQTIELSVERFTLPELLFHPTNVGIQQAGVAETVLQVLSDVKLKYPGKFNPSKSNSFQFLDTNYTSSVNVVCAGGNTMFPNFTERMYVILDAI